MSMVRARKIVRFWARSMANVIAGAMARDREVVSQVNGKCY